MSDTMEIILGRRSIRRYQEKDIPNEVLDDVLEAARWAPSWANVQPWEFVVVKDKSIKEQIQKNVPSRNPSSLAIVNAPVLLVVCGQLKKSGCYDDQYPTKFGSDWFMYDLGLATQNLCLAAHASGLGTVIVGLFDHDRVGEVINLPANHEVLVLIPIGYPNQKPQPRKRRERDEFVHFDTF
jgi:nitroreductase